MEQREPEPFHLGACLTIKTAAGLLGVTPETLRNWDRSGRLKARRHPVNGYRLYPLVEVHQLLQQAAEGGRDRGCTEAGGS